jgi:hypothetical protein
MANRLTMKSGPVPFPGQGVPIDLKVRCSTKMRSTHAIGTKFRIKAKVTDRQTDRGMARFFMCHIRGRTKLPLIMMLGSSSE